MTVEKISWDKITRLPIREIIKSDGVGGALLVKTPHRGEVIIDYQTPQQVGILFFSHTENRDTRTGEIINKLVALEQESKEYLLSQWLPPSINH